MYEDKFKRIQSWREAFTEQVEVKVFISWQLIKPKKIDSADMNGSDESLVYALESCVIKSFRREMHKHVKAEFWILATIISNSKQKFTSTTDVNSWFLECVSEFQLWKKLRMELYCYFMVKTWRDLRFKDKASAN